MATIKAITQDTFDGVVEENVNDFEMEEIEAVQDAIQQFSSQDIPLTMIIKESKINGEHRVIAATMHLQKLIKEYSTADSDVGSQIKEALENLSKLFQENLANRYQASKLVDAHNVVFNFCKTCADNNSIFQSLIGAFCSMLDGQPDLITKDGIIFFLSVLSSDGSILECDVVILKILRNSCLMHEANKVCFVASGGIGKVFEATEKHKGARPIVRELCGLLRTLTLDDDVRVQFGKAHDHTKMVVNEHKGMEKLFLLLRVHEDDHQTARELCLTLGTLMVRNEFCQQMVDLGGLDIIANIFSLHMHKQSMMKQCVTLVKAISGNDDVKVAVVKSGIVDRVLEVLSVHADNSQNVSVAQQMRMVNGVPDDKGVKIICEACLSALATLALRNPSHCDVIMSKHAAPLITQAMGNHPDSAGLQRSGCMAIRNLVARARQHCGAFIHSGAEVLVRNAREKHARVLDDEAKAALRDLEVHVDLQERWRGEKQGITA